MRRLCLRDLRRELAKAELEQAETSHALHVLEAKRAEARQVASVYALDAPAGYASIAPLRTRADAAVVVRALDQRVVRTEQRADIARMRAASIREDCLLVDAAITNATCDKASAVDSLSSLNVDMSAVRDDVRDAFHPPVRTPPPCPPLRPHSPPPRPAGRPLPAAHCMRRGLCRGGQSPAQSPGARRRPTVRPVSGGGSSRGDVPALRCPKQRRSLRGPGCAGAPRCSSFACPGLLLWSQSATRRRGKGPGGGGRQGRRQPAGSRQGQRC